LAGTRANVDGGNRQKIPTSEKVASIASRLLSKQARLSRPALAVIIELSAAERLGGGHEIATVARILGAFVTV
jgi:hypothetical protein